MLISKFLTNYQGIKNKVMRINVYSLFASLLISLSFDIALWFIWLSKNDYGITFNILVLTGVFTISIVVFVICMKLLLSYFMNFGLIKKINKINSMNLYYAYNNGDYYDYEKLREVVGNINTNFVTYDPELEKSYNSKFYIKKIIVKFNLWKNDITKIRIMSKKGSTYLMEWNYAKMQKEKTKILTFKYLLDEDANFKDGDNEKTNITGEIVFVFDEKNTLGRMFYTENYRIKKEYLFGEMFIVRKSELRYLKDVVAKSKQEQKIKIKAANKVIQQGEPTLDNIVITEELLTDDIGISEALETHDYMGEIFDIENESKNDKDDFDDLADLLL